MDRAEALAVFLRVVEEGDFSAAARRLRATPSAVSKQVARLEERLGVRLFQRTTRRLTLTDEGRTYADWARRILADLEEADGAVQSGGAPRGRLRVSVPAAFAIHNVIPLLPEFLERHPAVELELILSDRLSDLVEDGVDVAIRVAALGDSRMVVRKLSENRRIVCAAPRYLERHGMPLVPADLARHVCLGIAEENNLNLWEFLGPDGPQVVRIRGVVESNSTEALYQLALAGVGLVRLSEYLVGPDIRAGRLVPVLADVNDPRSPPISLVYPHRRHLSPRVRAFVDHLVGCFDPPPWERG